MSLSASELGASLKAHVPGGTTGLVMALSGGADSAGLLRALAALRSAPNALPLRAVHVDHGLTSAACALRRACEALCTELGIGLRVLSVTVGRAPGTSLEAAAREARYAALAEELGAGECLLTAHHEQDQAETVLLQAVRGAGLKGLSAMPACRKLGRGWHVRPLLEVAHQELQGLAGEHSWVADPMNRDPRFDRSFLRLEIWPLLERRWAGAGVGLARAARHAAAAGRLIERAAAAHVARIRDGDALSVPGLRALDPEARLHVVRFWLCSAEVEPPSTAKLLEALRQVLDSREDHIPQIRWGTHALRRYRQRLFLTVAQPPRLTITASWALHEDATVELGEGLGTLRWGRGPTGLDAARLPPALIVRRRCGGEALRPAANGRTQTVQHLCQSWGVLPWMRDALPYIFAGEHLTAVADLWRDSRCCSEGGEAGWVPVWENAPAVL